MTPFALLGSLAGLSHREAALVCRVRLDTVKSWASGRNRCPPGALDEVKALIARQERAADEAVAQIARLAKSHGAPDAIEIGYPADDHEAQSLGWPCVGAWAAMAARVVVASPITVALVPRGSAPGGGGGSSWSGGSLSGAGGDGRVKFSW